VSKENPNDLLDRATAAVRDQPIAPAEVEAARVRVRQRLEVELRPGQDAGATIRGCADVQALLKAYKAGTLAPARELLVQDHLRECAVCRAVHAQRGVGKLLPWRAAAPEARGRSPLPRFAVAAALLVLVGGLALLFRGSFTTAPGGKRAVLASAEGAVYVVSKHGQRRLAVGGDVAEGDWVRTPRGTRAVLRLLDGSRVEAREHAELGVSMNRRDFTVHLERGSIIVRAAKQRDGHLVVNTEDLTVSVTGTVFSVSRGIKGTRVSVIEGSVRVEDRRGEHTLGRGEQYASNARIAAAPIRDEIGWSEEVGQHLAALNDIAALDDKLRIEKLPGLRYDSRLVSRLPAGTVLVAAIPNYEQALGQVQTALEERLKESEVLRRFWREIGANDAKVNLSELVRKARGLWKDIGDEIVIALVPAEDGRNVVPVALAEVRGAGLRERLQSDLGALGIEGIRLLDEGSLPAAVAAHRHEPVAVVTGTHVAFSLELAALRRVVAAPAGGFAETAFGRRVADCYRDGAGLLVAVDVETIANKIVAEQKGVTAEEVLRGLGAKDMRHLVIEHEQIRGATQNRATLSFEGLRAGVASWLAAPAPMGSLDFVGPGASFAAAFAVKDPALVLDDLVRLGEAASPDFRQGMQRFEWQAGIQLRNDLAAPLGNDVTVAIDGPLLPVPSWKMVMEVHDPDLLSLTLERLVAEFNRQATADGRKALVFEKRPAQSPLNAGPITSSHTYLVRLLGTPFEAHLLFTDGYLVAAPSDELLRSAVRARQRGRHLRNDWRFRELLPPDRQANFSGLVYHNLGQAGAAVSDWLGGGDAFRPEQQAAIEALTASAKPGLLYVYGEPNQIQVATAGGVFGLTLNHVLGSAGLVDLLDRQPRALK
jgi:ferric-dicitrate binding protein FerR (iron transport regulator)